MGRLSQAVNASIRKSRSRANRGTRLGRSALSIHDEDIQAAVENLRLIGRVIFNKRKLQQPIKDAAKILQEATRNNIPVSEKPHHRYNTPKIAGAIRAPKDAFPPVATYHPGNLRKSFKVMTFRRSFNVYVGFRVDKKFKPSPGKTKQYRGNVIDGYYAVMRVEIGEAPVRKAVASHSALVGRAVFENIKEFIRKELPGATA